jgi:hypothetical protein
MTAGHGAGHHSCHVMPAIHMISRCHGSFVVMVRGNFALAGHAAGGLIGGPSGARQRRIKQNDHEQANARGDRTAAILTHSSHVIFGTMPIVGHYIVVARHSLQARIKWLQRSFQYTPDTVIFR